LDLQLSNSSAHFELNLGIFWKLDETGATSRGRDQEDLFTAINRFKRDFDKDRIDGVDAGGSHVQTFSP
jgi:hypothetical protein